MILIINIWRIKNIIKMIKIRIIMININIKIKINKDKDDRRIIRYKNYKKNKKEYIYNE